MSKKSTSPVRTISGRRARRELRRARALARRGPLAAYRLALSLVSGMVVSGGALFDDVRNRTTPDDDLLRFGFAFGLVWVSWGVIDSVFADVQHRQEREADVARRVAELQRRREQFNMAVEEQASASGETVRSRPLDT